MQTKHRLEQAKQVLSEGGFTLVLCSGSAVRTSTLRGVAPLLQLLDEGQDLSDCCAADKVVGKGAAFLYILLHIEALYADVISRPACNLLQAHRIPVTYRTMTDAIRNRDCSGLCPIESAVMEIENPRDALTAIRTKLKELNQQR